MQTQPDQHKEISPAAWAAEANATWEAELIRRYQAGLPLTRTDKREARKLIKARGL